MPPAEYEPWLRALFGSYFQRPDGSDIPFAERHHEFWRWVWALERGVRPRPLVAIWPRGGGKSTNAEMACVAAGARRTRRYVLYVSGTQEQADDHVGNVAAMLESPEVERYYPLMAQRALGKYGNSRGWRRNRLRTAQGNFTVDALGLDTAARGVKLEDMRPDLIVFDDLDDTADSAETVEKKILAITRKLLPAGSSDAATLAVQNLVYHESIFARLAGLATVEADWLADRIVLGPYPALIGAKFERVAGTTRWRVIAGEPTWTGQGLDVCQSQVDDWGLTAFKAEAQHEPTPPLGQAFPEWDATVHVVEPFRIPSHWPRWRAVDYGYAVPYCCLWAARAPDGTIYVYRETYGSGKPAESQAVEVKYLSVGEKYFASVGDPAMWAEKREGKVYESVATQYAKAGVVLGRASNQRIVGWARIHELLDWHADPESGRILAWPRLRVFRTCANLIRTLPKMVRDAHKPEDIDTTLEDHACLVAGTPVTTERGDVPIERVAIGDRVLTRDGWRRVMAAGQTSASAPVLTAHLSNGRTLTGTGNHPIWMPSRGWVRLDALRYGDILMSCEEPLSASPSTAPSTVATRTVCAGRIAATTARVRRIVARVRTGCTATSTATITGRFRTATTSTTVMGTPSTTTRATSNVSLPTSIALDIRSAMLVGSASLKLARSHWQRPLSGTARMPAERGTASMASGRGKGESLSSASARAAASTTQRARLMTPRGSAPTPASRDGDALRDLTTSSEPARAAARPSNALGTTRPSRVPVVVSGLSAAGVAPVFNLTVEGTPEFFASGVLTHNCDTLRYLAMAAPWLEKRNQKPSAMAVSTREPDDPLGGLRVAGGVFTQRKGAA